ncbi:MAG TPA: hypothetical protein GX500_05790 [Firmicutes bacterium]|nr:hypothetical protein [Candidatus Fermentithermobacillaceae bacterium]
MAFLTAALLFVAKVVVAVAAGCFLAVLLFLALPVRAAVQGECRLEVDTETLEDLEDAGASGSIETTGWARLAVLGGFLGASFAVGDPPEIRVAGVTVARPVPSERARRKTVSQEPVYRTSGRVPPKPPSREKKGSLGAIKSRLSAARMPERDKAAAGSANRKRFSFTLRLEKLKRWLAPEVRDAVLGAVVSLVRALHPSGKVSVRGGLGDPGVTGMAYAAFVTWSGMTGQKWLSVEPEFVTSSVSVKARGEIWFLPVQLVYLLARFFFAREIRPLWLKKRAGKFGKAPLLGAHRSG